MSLEALTKILSEQENFSDIESSLKNFKCNDKYNIHLLGCLYSDKYVVTDKKIDYKKACQNFLESSDYHLCSKLELAYLLLFKKIEVPNRLDEVKKILNSIDDSELRMF